jgi:DNA-binding beta-propeller fold protein YncE
MHQTQRLAPSLLVCLLLTACSQGTIEETVPTPAPTISPTHTPIPTPQPDPPPAGPLPRLVDAFTLGDAPQACVGSTLAIDPQTGYLYLSGQRDEDPLDDTPGEPCFSVIDPATDQVLETRTSLFDDAVVDDRLITGNREGTATERICTPTNRIFAIRQFYEESGKYLYALDVLDATTLETINSTEMEWLNDLVADPSLGRVYTMASEGRILAFDATSGQLLGTVFTAPEPFFGCSSKLHHHSGTNRIHLVYKDCDDRTWWVASFNPATPVLSADGTSVAEGGEGVVDVQAPGGSWVLDSTRGRLIFAGRDFLLGLDAVTLQPVWRMSLSRDPVSAAVAPDQGLLFVGDAGGDVHVLDSQTHAEVQLLPGVGGYVDVDTVHGWLYAGDEFAPGVSVYDLATLELRGVIPQPGRPTASPADGRVYILEEDVYSADGATLKILRGRTERNRSNDWMGHKYTGIIADPATDITLTIKTSWQHRSSDASRAAVDPTTGRAFVAEASRRETSVFYVLTAYADLTQDDLLTERRGLYGQMLYNPLTDHLYLAGGPCYGDNSHLIVLDGATLDPIGWLQPRDDTYLILAAVNAQSGRFYLLAGSEVLVMASAGGQAETPPPEPVAGLPGRVEGIVPLQSAAPRGMLFVRTHSCEDCFYLSQLYRSTDGGTTWEHVRGGLHGAPNDLVSAPDGTLYAAAGNSDWQVDLSLSSVFDGWSEGVYRSQDGGDTWTLTSHGLAHLGVARLHVGKDGTAYAFTAGSSRLEPTIWRLGADDRWTPVEIPDAGPSVDAHGNVPITYTLAVDAFWHTLTGGTALYRGENNELQRSADGGETWETIGVGPVNYADKVIASTGDPPTLYWIKGNDVYRSLDGGVEGKGGPLHRHRRRQAADTGSGRTDLGAGGGSLAVGGCNGNQAVTVQ